MAFIRGSLPSRLLYCAALTDPNVLGFDILRLEERGITARGCLCAPWLRLFIYLQHRRLQLC